jgi:hypothetical protein
MAISFAFWRLPFGSGESGIGWSVCRALNSKIALPGLGPGTREPLLWHGLTPKRTEMTAEGIRWPAVLGFMAMVLPSPASTQQKATSPTDLAVPPVLGAPIPAESGKPLTLTPPPIAVRPDDAAGCVPGLPCGARLTGAVQKNGAVAIEFPALK